MTIPYNGRPQCKRKLNAEQVRAIRAYMERGYRYDNVAQMFGVSRSCIKRVCEFSTYKEVR